MQNNITKSIIDTLVYSDIFDFPLNAPEIFKYYMGEKSTRQKIYSNLDQMVRNKIIGKSGSYYFLNGRRSICLMRVERAAESKKKWAKAIRVCKVLKLIPTVKLIGISGSLSMKNCDKRDDIDLFITTSSGYLWTTRFLVNVVLLALGEKRSKKDSLGIDRVCPNMFLSENSLKINENIFSAHEIAQLKVVVNKDQAHEKFLLENSWVGKLLPNVIRKSEIVSHIKKRNAIFVEKILYKSQYMYMEKSITVEKVSENIAQFHPKDKTNFVIELYQLKSKMYQGYLASDFYNKFEPKNNGLILQDIDI